MANVLVSIVMSVYNGETTIRKSIESVLNQTYRDYELIIVDDGSTDSSLDIIRSYDDKRIKIIKQSNKGLAASLNAGIWLSQGQYIARQDSDDIWFPNKLKLQVEYIEAYRDIDVLGCAAEFFDDNEGPVSFYPLSMDPKIESPFLHASVLIRKSALEETGGYDSRFRYAQDRELWLRMYNGRNFHVLPEVLISLRAAKATSVYSRMLYPNYSALVQKIARFPQKRECLINNFMSNIHNIEANIRHRIRTESINSEEWLLNDYHKNWGGRYLKNGDSRRARLHLRKLHFMELSLHWKLKYVLSYFPGKFTVVLMNILLYLRRR